MKGRVSIIIPGRCEQYFCRTVESVLESATGDIEVVAVVDGPGQKPPVVSCDPRVKILNLDKSIGQRAAYNLGVRESTGEYVMKIDAHALLSKGFDEDLKSYCPDNAVVLPEMRRLDPRLWQDKPKGKTHFMYFGLDLYCHYWKDYGKRPEARGDYPEVLTGQGSCWFTTRTWNDYIGLLNEAGGSWGNVGIEVSLRTWLCGGVQIVNKKAWQAHWFRVGEGGFPYPMDGRKVGKAHKFTWENYYFKEGGAFPHQVRPFRWLIEKFAPVPGWEAYLTDFYQSPRHIVWYSDADDSLNASTRKWLSKISGLIPVHEIVLNAPQSPVDKYETLRDAIGKLPAEAMVYLCEGNVFYHPSHFAKTPKTKSHFFFNRNRFYWEQGLPEFVGAGSKRILNQAVAYRECWLKHIEERLLEWKAGRPGYLKVRYFQWDSNRPNVIIPKEDGSADLWKEGRAKVANLPGWGGPSHFQSQTSYKGVMRRDIIQYLIDRYKFKSYLEIGTKSGDTFKRIKCELKHGVDPKGGCATHPVTSDEFFFKAIAQKYDLIFIDGLHEAEQVKQDIGNALKHLNPGGVIVMHDCSPRDEAEQEVPRDPKQKIWTGDVWKAFVYYRRFSYLDMYVVDTNNGIGVIRHGEQEPLFIEAPAYQEFELNREKWLNLKSVKEFLQWEKDRGKNTKKIRSHEPVAEDIMHQRGDDNTICQVLREIYFMVEDQVAKTKCRIAMAMAKAMTAKLKARGA